MSATHLHLVINHIPVVGFLLLVPVIVYAFFKNSKILNGPILIAVLLIALTALPAFFSGESAEDFIEDTKPELEVLLENHEDTARIAMLASLATGAVALLAYILFRYDRLSNRLALTPVFIAVLISTGLMGLAARHGGWIAHPELRPASLYGPDGKLRPTSADDDSSSHSRESE